MNLVFLLIVLFQIKHFIADYPLQGKYMLGKFRETGWVKPLAAHAGVHAFFTYAIVGYLLIWFEKPGFTWMLFALPAFDFITHFTMDRIKASPNLLGRFKDMYDYKFWWCLGFDQLFHHFSDLFIVYVLIQALQNA